MGAFLAHSSYDKPNHSVETQEKKETVADQTTDAPNELSKWIRTTKDNWRNGVKKMEQMEVVWFPVNDLQSEEKPFLRPDEEFRFETLPLDEATKRIYKGEYDFDKYLAHQLEGTTMALACAFFMGTLYGGTMGYYEGKEHVSEYAKQYRGYTMNSKERAKLYNEGAYIIKNRVSRNAIATGLKFSCLAGSFGLVNYQMAKYRRKSDPLNFGVGGLAVGIFGGFQGGFRGICYAVPVMGVVGLTIGGILEVIKFGAAGGFHFGTNKDE